MTALPQDASSLQSLLASDSQNAEAHAALGLLMLKNAPPIENGVPNGDIVNALMHFRDAINYGYWTSEIIRPFIQTLGAITTIPRDWNIEGAFLRALRANLMSVFEFRPALMAILDGQTQKIGIMSEAIKHAWQGNEQALENLLIDSELRDVLAHPALTAVMKSTVIASFEIEYLFAYLRRHYLNRAIGDDANVIHPSERAFCYALADQCFLSEYAIWSNSEENLHCDILAETFNANLAENPNLDPFPAAILACYKPLVSFPWATKLDTLYPTDDPEGFGAIVQRHIREPEIEKELMASLTEVAEISNETSLAVKEQYEEHPYPRWVTPAIGASRPFQENLDAKFPNSDLTYLKQITIPEILVAGCGTGQQIVHAFSAYDAWNVTAIDVSRASLAYAQRQIQKHKFPNIDFLLCDILNVGQLGKQFDIIDCTGVLHHMADPLEGWRALIDVLKPGGVMSIGLYSATARRGIVEAQAYAKKRNFASDSIGIRQFRHEILEAMRDPADRWNKQDAALLGVALNLCHDFYSTSMCRDLVFHVQEKNYTLQELESAISDLGLRFMGFKFETDASYKNYFSRFPGDRSGTNFKNWITFEKENPDTFLGMYNFDVQKPLS